MFFWHLGWHGSSGTKPFRSSPARAALREGAKVSRKSRRNWRKRTAAARLNDVTSCNPRKSHWNLGGVRCLVLVCLDQLIGIKKIYKTSHASLRAMHKSTGSPVFFAAIVSVQDQEMYREKAQRILQGPGGSGSKMIEVYLSQSPGAHQPHIVSGFEE